VVYCLGLFLLYEASHGGEFGITLAGVAVLLFILPSMAFLLFGVPGAVVPAIRKPIATPGARAEGRQPSS